MNNSPNSRLQTIALIGLATLLGGIVRLATPLTIDFPLNDGGLFYVMIRDLRAGNYVLPLFAHYNGAAIPFAYPPLGFYATSLLADLFHADLIDVMRWLPPIVSALTIPAFYFLARGLSRSPAISALATFAFAFLPRDFIWLIMGGGVTRSFGFLFAILTLACAHRLFTTPAPRLIFWTSIGAALTVLTHPEAAAQTAFAALLLFLFFGRVREGLFRALAVAGLTLALTSPWWGLMLARYGLDPFLAAAQATADDRSGLFNFVMRFVLLFRFEFTNEAFLPLLTVFGLIGLFAALGRGEWFLPAWLAASLFFEPRSAPLFMSIPLAILAAEALSGIILPALEKTGSKRIPPVFPGLLLVYLFLSAQYVVSTAANEISLTPYDRETMQWVEANTPEDSVFLVVTGELPLRDAVSEWFPALTSRVSAATVFGYEWVHDGKFAQRTEGYRSLQGCMDQRADCLLQWSEENGRPFTHVMIRNFRSGEFRLSPLQISLDHEKGFTLVFRTPEISIYQLTER